MAREKIKRTRVKHNTEHRKEHKRLQARIHGYSQCLAIAASTGLPAGGFHCPGSLKK